MSSAGSRSLQSELWDAGEQSCSTPAEKLLASWSQVPSATFWAPGTEAEDRRSWDLSVGQRH